MTVDYPLLIGGKPTFALPAFIPVTFELSVLIGSLGTVAVMLFIFFKLPNNSHPIHDSEYIKAVSVDKFGISIEAKDKNFDELKVKEFLLSTGAHSVTTIYWDPEEIGYKHRVFEPKFITFLVIIAIITSGTTYLAINKLVYASPFNFMVNQDRQNVQSKSVFFKDGFGMRPPVEGTVARGHMPVLIGKAEDSLWVNYENPLPVSKESLDLGKKKFDIYCSPCHGMYAKGDSRLRGQFPNPPSLHSEKVRNWKDSQIFLVITNGQNSMPSYASQLEVKERWAVVNYVRAIQRALNAKEGDLK
jgi:mono/diheme cytochrome c family protein